MTENKCDRRRFLLTTAAAGAAGAVALTQAFGQSAPATPIEGLTRDQLRRDMMAGIEDDVRKDVELRAKAVEELPKTAGIRPDGMLDARFSVAYKTALPEAMKSAMTRSAPAIAALTSSITTF